MNVERFIASSQYGYSSIWGPLLRGRGPGGSKIEFLLFKQAVRPTFQAQSVVFGRPSKHSLLCRRRKLPQSTRRGKWIICLTRHAVPCPASERSSVLTFAHILVRARSASTRAVSFPSMQICQWYVAFVDAVGPPSELVLC